MAEHRIRLRGGWDCIDPASGADVPVRLALPAPRDAFPARRVRLVRRFGRPPKETLEAGGPAFLRLDRVPGLVGLSFNGAALDVGEGRGGSAEVPLPRLEERNVLELTVELDAEEAEDAGSWGEVALVLPSGDGPPG
ncbi:hypothetical protein OJF2_49050 [Aquisphaera giovannonii]|uniref:Uncharacterized protein n=1 Tax=Aquisphaera giovannonii TaxID=406548 RepID=A0A5B9W7Y2_9BACT|nr:hypothetical protein [Aquisphaera giovannonii]QEH36344.1 hypothetical protein OJF2_49050 [Aquisphaera giovannonii]